MFIFIHNDAKDAERKMAERQIKQRQEIKRSTGFFSFFFLQRAKLIWCFKLFTYAYFILYISSILFDTKSFSQKYKVEIEILFDRFAILFF